jgi:DNA-binding response OmpR family regulator
LTDVILPRTSGRELAERLRLSRGDTKVLFMSGYTGEAVVRHGVLDSGAAFIQKPITPESLARRIREVLDAREATAGIPANEIRSWPPTTKRKEGP